MCLSILACLLSCSLTSSPLLSGSRLFIYNSLLFSISSNLVSSFSHKHFPAVTCCMWEFLIDFCPFHTADLSLWVKLLNPLQLSRHHNQLQGCSCFSSVLLVMVSRKDIVRHRVCFFLFFFTSNLKITRFYRASNSPEPQRTEEKSRMEDHRKILLV